MRSGSTCIITLLSLAASGFRLVCLLFPIFFSTISPAQETEQTETAPSFEDVVVDKMIESDTENVEKDFKTGLSEAVLNPEIDPVELDYRLVPLTKDELEKLAAEWLQIVKAKTEEVMAAQIAIFRTDASIEDTAREKLTALNHDRRVLFGKYAMVISAWEKKGGDPEVIKGYRSYQNAIIVEETRTADFETLLARVQEWLFDPEGGIEILIDIVIVIAALIFLLFLAKLVQGVVRKWLFRLNRLSKLLQVFIVGVTYWLVLAIGIMVVLAELGVDITPAFALIGGASFILAFAFQDTLGNLASGMMIMINQPFDQGDYVEVSGVGGTVKKVSIVATTIATPDNQLIVIPNRNVWGNVITNVTASSTRRVDFVFGISYDSSISKAAAIIEELVQSHPLILNDPAPIIRVHELADNSVNIICRPWSKTDNYWTVFWDLNQQVKERFDTEGISIPFQQRDVHLHYVAKDKPDQVELEDNFASGVVRTTPTEPNVKTKAEAIAQGETDDK